MIEFMEPIHQRREQYTKHPEHIREIVFEGNRKAQEYASQTLEQVREAMKI